MSIDAMNQALEVLESVVAAHGYNSGTPINAITALRAAIEQAQEPETELETYKRLYELRGKALERPCSNCGHQPAKIKAMAQPEQEPVAWMNPSWIDPDTRGWASDSFESIQIEGWIPLYTAPRQWQGLTDQEIWSDGSTMDLSEDGIRNFARAIEAKLREKNS